MFFMIIVMLSFSYPIGRIYLLNLLVEIIRRFAFADILYSAIDRMLRKKQDAHLLQVLSHGCNILNGFLTL